MNNKIIIPYYDRKERKLKTEQVYASRFLYWSYNTRAGQWSTDMIFRRRFISWLYGWLNKRRWSRWKIKPFVKTFDVNLDELIQSLNDFASFNDFFIREIKLSKRSINNDPGICIAPSDGKIHAYPFIKPEMTFRIKHNTFNLCQFLKNDSLADHFKGGSMLISRLCLADYHHFHFPDSGLPHHTNSIPGNYHAGGSYSLRKFIPFYTENHRTMTHFDSDHFGRMIIAEIGALTVGSIRQCFHPEIRVDKGARKGYFELGGSTVILLFQKGIIELDGDLCTNTQRGIETYVNFGDSVGRSRKSFSHTKKQKGVAS
jgi:phosphatidylserine decarboxylase